CGVAQARAAERVLADDLEVLDAVKDEVHPSDGCGVRVLLLTEDLAEEGSSVPASLAYVLDSTKEHAARATGRVVDGLAFFRIEDVDHHPHDAPRGVELAGLLAFGHVREATDQVLVRIPQDVRRHVLVPEGDARQLL